MRLSHKFKMRPMPVQRARPAPPLDAFVESYWYSIGGAGARGRERALPSATASLVFNLNDLPLHGQADLHDRCGWRIHGAIVHGPQSRWFVLGERAAMVTVGVHFRPGGASAVLGLPMDELRDLHVGLYELWGVRAADLRERLIEAATPPAVFQVLDRHLRAALRPRPLLMHPAVSQALRLLDAPGFAHNIAAARQAAGYGHKRFNELFSAAVGLTPKLYQRVRRFDATLAQAFAQPALSWAELAADGGFVDQAHLHRDFVDFTGLTPGAWRAAAKRERGHVPL